MPSNQSQRYGFDQNTNGFNGNSFANMNMNGFNPMMGMPGFGMGMPGMMGKHDFLPFNHTRLRSGLGMPGMGMDQSMMFNGGFGGGGMGDMSMMGMGMGMGGVGGMGNFNEMGGPGFFPNQGNYMQSNFGNAHRQNFFHDRGYGRPYGRGYGRGSRGNQFGRGRGGWGYQNHQNGPQHQYAQQQQAYHQTGPNMIENAHHRRGSPSYDGVQGSSGSPTDHREASKLAGAEDDNATTMGTDQAGDGATNPTGVISVEAKADGEDVDMSDGNHQPAQDTPSKPCDVCNYLLLNSY